MTNVASGRRVRFESILLATDFSATSDRAFEIALALAARYGATLHLVHVVNEEMAGEGAVPEVSESTYARLRDFAVDHLSVLAEDSEVGQVKAKTAALQGPLWPALEAYIRKEKVDLIVAGTHGRKGWAHAVLGSGAEEIFRRATLPVLVVGPGRQKEGAPEMRTIVYATDLSPHAAPAAEYAASLAQEFEAKLVLLHAAPPHDLERIQGLALAKSYVEALQATVPAAAATWAEVEYEIAAGDADEQVPAVAGKRGADLIVIGARRAGGLALRLPSTAQRIIARAACPVLVIPSTAPETARDVSAVA